MGCTIGTRRDGTNDDGGPPGLSGICRKGQPRHVHFRGRRKPNLRGVTGERRAPHCRPAGGAAAGGAAGYGARRLIGTVATWIEAAPGRLLSWGTIPAGLPFWRHGSQDPSADDAVVSRRTSGSISYSVRSASLDRYARSRQRPGARASLRRNPGTAAALTVI